MYDCFDLLPGEDDWHLEQMRQDPQWGAEIAELFGVEGDATQEEVTSSSRYSSPCPPPSPSELANMSPWDRAYEQALDVWMKEHPNLARAEARRSFENDDEYLDRVSTIFQGA